MVKTVTIRNVDEQDWDTIVNFANRVNISMAELMSLFAEMIRESENQNNNSLRSFLQEQRQHRRQFILQRLGFS